MIPPPRVVKASSIENSLFLLSNWLFFKARCTERHIYIYENAFKQPKYCVFLCLWQEFVRCSFKVRLAGDGFVVVVDVICGKNVCFLPPIPNNQ